MTARIVSVIGGGWSFGVVDHKKVPGEIIGVNDALVYFRGDRLDAVVSMDRLWTEGRWSHMEDGNVDCYLRRTTLQNVPWREKTLPWLHTYENSITEPLMSLDPKVLNGRNSGAVAINLAFTMRPTELYLFGFDMCLSPQSRSHWHPPYPWSKGPQGNTGAKTFQHWVGDMMGYEKQFRDLGTKVLNVSPDSRIGVFKKVSARELGIAL